MQEKTPRESHNNLPPVEVVLFAKRPDGLVFSTDGTIIFAQEGLDPELDARFDQLQTSYETQLRANTSAEIEDLEAELSPVKENIFHGIAVGAPEEFTGFIDELSEEELVEFRRQIDIRLMGKRNLERAFEQVGEIMRSTRF